MADSIDIDVSDLLDFADELGQAAIEIDRKAYEVTKTAAKTLERKWRSNARSSAGVHGKHYPRAITSEQVPAMNEAWWQVGPESHLPQGGMGEGFEYGSKNQPPHHDMTSVMPEIEAEMIAALDKAARDLL